MGTIPKKSKISIALLAFLAGSLITSFFVSIPTIEQGIRLRISALQLLQVMEFFVAFICLFPALHFTQKNGPKWAVMYAAMCILVGSFFLVIFSNQYSILASRILDGMAGALIIAIFYTYAEHRNLNLAPYLFSFACGIIMGPLIAHYYVYYSYTMIFTYVVFFGIPATIMFLCGFMENDTHLQLKNHKSWYFSALMIGILTPILILSLYYNHDFLGLPLGLGLIAICVISFLLFFYMFNKNHERKYLTRGLTRIDTYIVSSNLIFISAILIFWVTIFPIYLVQVSAYSFAHSYYVVSIFNFSIVAGAYYSYFANKKGFKPHRMTQAYIITAIGLIVILRTGQSFEVIQLHLGTLFVGLGVGMIFLNVLQLLFKLELKQSRILVMVFFYVCCGIFIGYVPLSSYFYYIERVNNDMLLVKNIILLPPALGKPGYENFMMLGDPTSVSQYFSHEDFIKLKSILNNSFIKAFNSVMTLLIIVGAFVLMFSNHFLFMKENPEK